MPFPYEAFINVTNRLHRWRKVESCALGFTYRPSLRLVSFHSLDVAQSRCSHLVYYKSITAGLIAVRNQQRPCLFVSCALMLAKQVLFWQCLLYVFVSVTSSDCVNSLSEGHSSTVACRLLRTSQSSSAFLTHSQLVAALTEYTIFTFNSSPRLT